MANCSDAKCRCVVAAGNGVTVVGVGSVENPFVIHSVGAQGSLRVFDTDSIDLVLTGNGTQGDPYTLTANLVEVDGGTP